MYLPIHVFQWHIVLLIFFFFKFRQQFRWEENTFDLWLYAPWYMCTYFSNLYSLQEAYTLYAHINIRLGLSTFYFTFGLKEWNHCGLDVKKTNRISCLFSCFDCVTFWRWYWKFTCNKSENKLNWIYVRWVSKIKLNAFLWDFIQLYLLWINVFL